VPVICGHERRRQTAIVCDACAALVKLLRRTLTQLLAKNEEFVRRSLQFEQLNSEQVRGHRTTTTSTVDVTDVNKNVLLASMPAGAGELLGVRVEHQGRSGRAGAGQARGRPCSVLAEVCRSDVELGA